MHVSKCSRDRRASLLKGDGETCIGTKSQSTRRHIDWHSDSDASKIGYCAIQPQQLKITLIVHLGVLKIKCHSMRASNAMLTLSAHKHQPQAALVA